MMYFQVETLFKLIWLKLVDDETLGFFCMVVGGPEREQLSLIGVVVDVDDGGGEVDSASLSRHLYPPS